MEPKSRSVAVIGRFQPFHWGHFEYLIEAARLGTQLIVGITNPTPLQTRFTSSDVTRSSPEANPFSYGERCEMIGLSLGRFIPQLDVQFVPGDLRSAGQLRVSLGSCDVVALTVYDRWGEEKLSLVQEAGYDVTVLWRRSQKMVSGTEVRQCLASGAAWEHMVPQGTRDVIRRRIHQSEICGQ